MNIKSYFKFQKMNAWYSNNMLYISLLIDSNNRHTYNKEVNIDIVKQKISTSIELKPECDLYIKRLKCEKPNYILINKKNFISLINIDVSEKWKSLETLKFDTSDTLVISTSIRRLNGVGDVYNNIFNNVLDTIVGMLRSVTG